MKLDHKVRRAIAKHKADPNYQPERKMSQTVDLATVITGFMEFMKTSNIPMVMVMAEPLGAERVKIHCYKTHDALIINQDLLKHGKDVLDNMYRQEAVRSNPKPQIIQAPADLLNRLPNVNGSK